MARADQSTLMGERMVASAAQEDGSTPLIDRKAFSAVQESRARVVGGGPRLEFAEWVALIVLFHCHAGDQAGLSVALEDASTALARIALRSGASRAGTQLRSPAGLRRRLTVLRALSAGRGSSAPLEAQAAWTFFADAPDDAFGLGWQVLGKAPVEQRSKHPSRGPLPFSGAISFFRNEGPASVYVMILANEGLTASTTTTLQTIKVGWSFAPERRLAQLNVGFPPDFAWAWRLHSARQFADAREAYDFEQQLLEDLRQLGAAIGGEFARLEVAQVNKLLAR